MNKKDLIKKISGFTGLTNEEKSYLTELVKTKKKYGLVWENKPEDVEEQLRSMLPVFKEVKERAIISEKPEAPNHILIEGDNLHALTALTYTHEGKIDVIYIDPPYNTGNKDFKYNDTFVDKEDSFRHSKWLSFIDKRLRLSKDLLSETGIILISIDDNENSQIKLLSDEIFGEKNFIANLIWKKKAGGGSDAKYFAVDHEYILVYAKNETLQERFFVELTDKLKNDYKFKDDNFELLGPYKRKNLYQTGIDSNRPNLRYEILAPDNSKILPPTIWRWSVETFNEALEAKKIDFLKNSKGEWSVYTKMYLFGEEGNEYKIKPRSILTDFGTTRDGGQELKDIFETKMFDYPKSTRLLKYLFSIGFKNKKNGKILDFFSGSGTTLHATMALNAEDGGNRQCILVTNNENNICEEVTYERNKRVIDGYTNAKGIEVEGLENNNLRYFQADFVPSERTEINRRLLTARSTDLLCIKENCFISKTKDWKINEKQAQIFTNGLGKYMVVVYHSRITDSVIEQITKKIETLDTTEKVKVYAFNPTKDSIEDDFFKVADKIVAVPLPDSIYNAYLATFRSLKINKDTL